MNSPCTLREAHHVEQDGFRFREDRTVPPLPATPGLACRYASMPDSRNGSRLATFASDTRTCSPMTIFRYANMRCTRVEMRHPHSSWFLHRRCRSSSHDRTTLSFQ